MVESLKGYGIDLGATYVADLPWKPALTLGYAYGTGDDNTRDGVDHKFRQPDLEDNSARFNGIARLKYYGELFDPELSNMAIFTAGLGIRPTRRTSIDLVFHSYRQNELDDDQRSIDVDIDPNGLSTDLGREIDLVIGSREIRDLSIEFSVGYFNPGNAFPNEDAFLADFAVRLRL